MKITGASLIWSWFLDTEDGLTALQLRARIDDLNIGGKCPFKELSLANLNMISSAHIKVLRILVFL